MRYPPQLLDQIKARLSLIEEVRRTRPDLKKKGKYWWACCPFHNEKSPSFHVREEGNYYCFGCGASGDIFTYTMETQGSDFTNTVKDLARRAGITLPEPEQADPAAKSKREAGYNALAAAAAFFKKHLGTAVVAEYISRRGISPTTLEEFGIGYAPDGWTGTRDSLTQQGFSAETLRETGLTLASTKGKDDYDRFRARLMFPIEDLQGRVVAFGGRILATAKEGGKADDFGPKYLNSPETPFFSKSHLLFNLHRARPHMRQNKQAILVEGYMDVVALWQAGLKTAVAPMGTSVTEDQLALLWQQTDKPTVCLDGDAAGRSAAIRVAQKILPILEPGHSIQFVWLPDGEDPDSLIRKDGLAAFHTLLAQPTTLEDVLWQHLTAGKNLTEADARATIEGELGTLMATIRNTTVKRAYTQALKDRLWQATRHGRTASPKKAASLSEGTTTAPQSYRPGAMEDPAVRTMLAIILRWPEILPEVTEAVAHFNLPAGSDLANFTSTLLRGFTQGQAPATVVQTLQEGLFADLSSDLLRTTGVAALPEETRPLQMFTELATQRQARLAAKSRRAELLRQMENGIFDEDKWQQFRQL